MTSERAVGGVIAIAAAAAAVWWFVPPIAQDPAYHHMADERVMLGVPNALNVLSNAAFLLVGLIGLATALPPRHGSAARARGGWERWPYAALFAGTALTAFGSAYYHLAPGNARLVWDRLPMTLGFMGLLTAVIADRVSVRLARRLFAPLLVIGAGSVVYWYWSEHHGAGDLRPYALVQFGSLLAILVLVLVPGKRDVLDKSRSAAPGWQGARSEHSGAIRATSNAASRDAPPANCPRDHASRGLGRRSRHADGRYLILGLGVYAVSKLFEWADAPIFALGGVVSGHTLKHLAAAIAVGCVVVMLQASGDRHQATGIRRQATGIRRQTSDVRRDQ